MRGGDHLEAVLEWGAPSEVDAAEAARVGDWLRERGLEPLPMLRGLLVTGDRAAFAEAFGVRADEIARPGSLPVPPELAGAVASVTLAGPKRIMDASRPRR